MSGHADRFFFDTNILIYWLDTAEPKKNAAARNWVAAIWESRCGNVSWQVLNELYATATHKLGTPPPAVRELVETYSLLNPVAFDLPLLHRAWHWTDHARVPYWDALILAAAESAGCKYLLSEDFQTGRQFGDLTIVNPFLTSPADFGLQ
uniref:Ribonuclease VapC n=1 Tax=Solibacter usitatus (strain Ellin6076) TaxID=234267 RepID=Q01P26_SOLUE